MEDDLNVSESIAEESSTPEVVESNEPESMLEAIQEGLKPEDEPEEKEEPKEAEETKPEEETKSDSDDAPPENLSKKAQERFHNLVSKVKEKDEHISRLTADLEGIRTVMRDTGASPEDFAKAFDYMKAITSGDMDHVASVIREQVRQYTLMTGKQLQFEDPLNGFPDLRERVNSYQMDENTALEMARYRNQQMQQQQYMRQTQEQQQRSQYESQLRNQAISQVAQLGDEWAKTDPDYTFKEDAILKQIPAIKANFPPQLWPQQVRLLYETMSSMPIHKPVANNPAPLRASGQAGGARQPTSMLEALQAGLGYAGG